MSYNGYSNYETWCVNLWLNNDEGSFRYWSNEAGDCLTDAEGDRSEAASCLADMLRESIEESNPLTEEGGMYSDLLQSALDNVNWDELAENWLEGVEVE